MRRIVREYMAAAIHRAMPDLERYIAQHLRCPERFPYSLNDCLAAMQEIRGVKLTPRFRADYPPVDATIDMRVSLTASTRHREEEMRIQVFAMDATLHALGRAAGSGYDVTPERAELTAWWG